MEWCPFKKLSLTGAADAADADDAVDADTDTDADDAVDTDATTDEQHQQSASAVSISSPYVHSEFAVSS